ncbi:MAG TPA: nuclear transport factor 2 family protein [Thermoleophilaceae bacterium]|jgi:steroid delta-isomerase-like uncharacterized protein
MNEGAVGSGDGIASARTGEHKEIVEYTVEPTRPASDKARRTPEQAARALFAAIHAHDIPAILSGGHPDVVLDWDHIGVFHGHAGVREMFEGLFKAIPDIEMTVEQTVGDDRYCAVRWRFHGSFVGGPFAGVEPTGRAVTLRGCDVLEVENGLILRNCVYYDGSDFAREVGMLPPRDSLGERALFGSFNVLTTVRRAISERVFRSRRWDPSPEQARARWARRSAPAWREDLDELRTSKA